MENDDIIKLVRNIFNPLASRLGLQETSEITKHTTMELILRYLKNNIGVQITIDLSDFFIYVLLFKAEGNSIPIRYLNNSERGYFDNSGKRTAVYLQTALNELGIDCTKETKKIQELGGNYLNCFAMANILAQLLENNWLYIQSQLRKLFDS